MGICGSYCLPLYFSTKMRASTAVTLFSSANPQNVTRNIQWANEEPDWQLVQQVKEIIGDQQRVTWSNT